MPKFIFMKICLISFDYWGYDEKIAEELIQMGHETFHIKLSDFGYKYNSINEKIINFFKKNILKKNIKKIKTEEYILSILEKKGIQDQIIVINPERISENCHQKIKKFTSKYIAYLYDSLDRYDNKKIINKNIFTRVFTFDKKDALKYNLSFLPNYIHLQKVALEKKPIYKVLSISSLDDRFLKIQSIIEYLDQNKISHKSIFFGKRKPSQLRASATFTKQKLTQKQIQEKIEESEILLDIIRKNQTGLSFRFFDALALDKKIITTNQTISEYDFYNPNNILIIDEQNITIPDSFLNNPYQKIPDDIYNKYTLKNWIETVIKNE